MEKPAYEPVGNAAKDTAKQINVPVLFRDKSECCGCSACFSICPKNAISMIVDEEGFEYPILNANLCIGCQSCIKVCPFKI